MAATAGASAPVARRSEKVVGFGIARLSPTAP
jgi:hypothetical protein